MSEVTKAGRALGQGLMDVVGAVTSPVAPVLEQLPKIAAEYAALQGNTGPLQMMQQQQQQDLMKQLVQQQMQGMKTPQQDEQLQFSLASKDYSGASKRIKELRNTEQMISGLEKDSKIPEDDRLFIINFLKSGGNVNTAATLIQQARQSVAKMPEKALITKGRELDIAAKESAAQQKELAKGGMVGKISSVIDEQIRRGLITNLDQLKASIKAELKGTEAERETTAEELATFWTKNEPRFFGLLPDKRVFSGQPRTQPQVQQKPVQQPQGQILVSPSTGRKFMKNPDGTMTEIK
jgi:uncharacterized protein HemX